MSDAGNSVPDQQENGSAFLDRSNIHAMLTTLIDRLDSPVVAGTDVLPWGSPVPSFGDLSTSRVATLGINPSNREFTDESGNELQGPNRRFHTLNSLGLRSWGDVDARHLRLILETCRSYFFRNPYNAWFKRLDFVVSGAKASYYGGTDRACHLDLIPYATAHKWTGLTSQQRSLLLAATSDMLGLLMRDSPVQLLILNGSAVVQQFQDIAGVGLERQEMLPWALPRRSQYAVTGVAYRGTVDTLAGIALGRKILVLGFNHNLQGSFGVTSSVSHAIRGWVAQASEGAFS